MREEGTLAVEVSSRIGSRNSNDLIKTHYFFISHFYFPLFLRDKCHHQQLQAYILLMKVNGALHFSLIRQKSWQSSIGQAWS